MAKGRKTGGRTKGTLNKATADVKALAAEYVPMVVIELARLAKEAVSEQARVAACNALLDRACGKPPQSFGDDDDPMGGLIIQIIRRNADSTAS